MDGWSVVAFQIFGFRNSQTKSGSQRLQREQRNENFQQVFCWRRSYRLPSFRILCTNMNYGFDWNDLRRCLSSAKTIHHCTRTRAFIVEIEWAPDCRVMIWKKCFWCRQRREETCTMNVPCDAQPKSSKKKKTNRLSRFVILICTWADNVTRLLTVWVCHAQKTHVRSMNLCWWSYTNDDLMTFTKKKIPINIFNSTRRNSRQLIRQFNTPQLKWS